MWALWSVHTFKKKYNKSYADTAEWQDGGCEEHNAFFSVQQRRTRAHATDKRDFLLLLQMLLGSAWNVICQSADSTRCRTCISDWFNDSSAVESWTILLHRTPPAEGRATERVLREQTVWRVWIHIKAQPWRTVDNRVNLIRYLYYILLCVSIMLYIPFWNIMYITEWGRGERERIRIGRHAFSRFQFFFTIIIIIYSYYYY